MKTQLNINEEIIKKGGANLQKGIEAVGGFLYLTNERLIFESHKFNVVVSLPRKGLRRDGRLFRTAISSQPICAFNFEFAGVRGMVSDVLLGWTCCCNAPV